MADNVDNRNYAEDFSEASFWDKLLKYAIIAGKEVVEKALWLYYALEGPDVPAWAKATIIGALGYFIFPADAIPDILPAVGYADDLGVLTAAVAAIAFYINQNVKDKAASKLIDWFGE